ncbi:MAG: hypothetical protein FWD65_02625 [Coriobacteriia bacterium]|nr:hypothetical protein [Coriobacteriia bacterium]
MQRVDDFAIERFLEQDRLRRIATIVLVPLLTIAVLVTVALSIKTGLAASGDAWDLNNFLTMFTLKDASNATIFSVDNEGNVTGDPTVEPDTNYSIQMNFDAVPGGMQFGVNSSGVLTYTIPQQLTVMDTTSNVPIYDSTLSHDQIGTFTIAGNVVTVTPDPSYTTEDSPAWLFWSHDQNSHFTIQANASFVYSGDGDQQSVDVNFGSDIEQQIIIKPTPGDITVSKTLTAYNTVTHTTDASIIITASSGASDVIETLTDNYALGSYVNQANPGNIDFDPTAPGAFTITHISADGQTTTQITSYTVTQSSGASILFGTADQFIITLNPTVTLSPGDKLILKYTLKVKDQFIINQLASDNNTDENVGYGGWISNDIYVHGHDRLNNTLDKQARADTYTNAYMLSKSGGAIDSAGTAVEWTATIGDGYSSLAGVPITDTLTPTDQRFTGTLSADLYYNNDGVLMKMGTETFATAANGTTTAVFVAASDVTVTGADTGSGAGSITWNDNAMTYTPPTALKVNGNPVVQVKLSYTTTLPVATTQNPTATIKNTIKVTQLGVETQAVGTFTPSSSSSWNITKQGQLKADADGAYMQYTILAEVPSVYYGNNFYLTDSVGGQNNGRINVMYYDLDPAAEVAQIGQTGTATVDMNRLLNQDGLSVSVYDLTGTGALSGKSGGPTIDSLNTSGLDLSTLAPYAVSQTAFDTAAPTYSGTPVKGQAPAASTMNSNGSWNVLPTFGSNRSDWTMTFGSLPTTTPGSVVASSNGAGSEWPVNGDSLLAVTYKVYMSSPSIDNENGAWGSPSVNSGYSSNFIDQYSYNANPLYNTAYINTNGTALGTQYGNPGLIAKKCSPSWDYAPPTSSAALPIASPYFSSDGQYYFPYQTDFMMPYLTDLEKAPVYTDTFDPDLTFDKSDPNSYCYVALHYQPVKYLQVYDMLITVPANDPAITESGSTFSLDFAALATDPNVKAALYSRNNQDWPLDYRDSALIDGQPSFTGAGSPQACYNYLKNTVIATNNPTIAPHMPADWYSLNSSTASYNSFRDNNAIGTCLNLPQYTTAVNANPYCDGGVVGYSVDYLLTFATGKTLPADILDGGDNAKDLSNVVKVALQPRGCATFDLSGDNSTPFVVKPIGKAMPTTTVDTNNGNVVDVNINLNPYAIAVANGAGTIYEAVDTMSSNLMYVPGTLHVYQITPNQGNADVLLLGSGGPPVAAPTNAPRANWYEKTMIELTPSQMDAIQNLITTGEPIPASDQYTYYVDTAGDYGAKVPGNIYFYLPDGAQFEIDYQSLVEASPGQTVSFTNAISITGTSYTYQADGTDIKILNASGSGDSSNQSITLVKKDSEDSSKVLDGAIFALYGPKPRSTPDAPPSSLAANGTTYDVESIGTTPAGLDSATGKINIPLTVTGPDGQTYYYYEAEVTGSAMNSNGASPGTSGRVGFDHPLLLSQLNWTYLIDELLPPSGYKLNDPAATLFAMNGSTPADSSVPMLGSSNTLTVQDDVTGGPLLPVAGAAGMTPFIVSAIVLTAMLALFFTGVAINKTRKRMRALKLE